MAESHCPICFEPLAPREVAPCYDCGHDPTELEHLAQGRHRYEQLLALGEPVVLCDFCQVDFSSYDPDYFGRPRGTLLGVPEFRFVRELRDPRPIRDKYCPACHRRLAWLRFLAAVRAGPGHTRPAG